MVLVKKHIKLQLEVSLKNDMILGGSRPIELYHLIVKILDRDDAFEANFKDIKIYTFTCNNGFKIKSVWDEPFGALNDDCIMLPQLDKIGFDLKKTFGCDRDRYEYLKKMKNALVIWADDWKEFKYDGESFLEMKDNIWTISCHRRIKRKHYHTTRELMKKNIFF